MANRLLLLPLPTEEHETVGKKKPLEMGPGSFVDKMNSFLFLLHALEKAQVALFGVRREFGGPFFQ